MRVLWPGLATLLFALGSPVYPQENQSPTGKGNPTAVSWNEGKTTFALERAHLELSNRLQVRFSLTDETARPQTESFRIRRFKTKLDGWVYTKDLTFEMQLNWSEDKPLEDANVTYDFTRGKKGLLLKAGQFKVPFGRQELTSSGNQQFVDRSIVSNEFAKGRDIGIQVGGLAFDGQLDWRIGAFNGAGRNAVANDNNKLQYDVRLTWQPWGDVKYSESDAEWTQEPKLAVAAQYELNDRRGATAANDVKRAVWGGDLVFRFRGLWFFTEYYRAQDTPEVGAMNTRQGLNLQAGYFIVPKKLELALRWAELNPSLARRGDLRRETGLALGYFFNRHAHKLQADLRRITDFGAKKTVKELRLQYQVIF
ncbi:MAG: OprO/OprP family phosphate-selective porin [Thermoanaerobaculum sp.]|nr:OprO/OprP family phosphate-selective porin [Thermoanaerobaculum sp.]